MENLVNPDKWFTVMIPGYGDYKVTLMELRMLTGRDPRKSWSHFKAFQTMAGKEPNGGTPATMVDMPWFSDVKITKRDFEILRTGKAPIVTSAETNWAENKKRVRSKTQQKFNEFFEGLSQIANSFCKQFMAQVPNDLQDLKYANGEYILTSEQLISENIKFINTHGDLEAEQFETAWSIASDAWALDPQVGRPDFFSNGRLKSMAAFTKTIKEGDWGDAYGFEGGGLQSGGPDKGVNVRDMGDSWTYSRTFPSLESNPNQTPWDKFVGGGKAPSPMKLPQYNPQTNKFQQVVYNPWGKGPGQNKILGVSANILSLDGGPLEDKIYFIPESSPPPGPYPYEEAAAWVPCEAGSNPLILA